MLWFWVLAVTMQESLIFERFFIELFHGKAGRFSTALQLGKGDKSLSQSRCHQSLSLGGTANLIVVFPCARLTTPAVTKIQKRRVPIVTASSQPSLRSNSTMRL